MTAPAGAGFAFPANTGAGTASWLTHFEDRLHQRRFWIVQAMVILATLMHALTHLLEGSTTYDLEGLYLIVMYAVYLGPVLYASLNFGRSGAVPTAIWSALLTVPIILYWHHGSDRYVEGLQHLTIIALAMVIARHIDREFTARREAEMENVARRVSEAKYRGLFEAAGEAILVFDHGGIVREANAAASRLFNRSERELIGARLSSVVDDESVELLNGLWQGREMQRCDLPLTTPEGAERWFEPTCSLVPVSDDGPFIQALFHDVTEERERRQGLEAYTRRIIQAQEEERRRIARDLHDGSVQSVILLCRQLDDIETGLEAVTPVPLDLVAGARALAEKIADELRRFSRDLRPSILDDLGLAPAVRWLVNDLSRRTGIEGELRAQGLTERLSADEALALFRIAQEALRNVERHSGARHVQVALTCAETTVSLDVVDDGGGFMVSALPPSAARYAKLGLMGMQERARLLGGNLTVASEPGAGTRIHVSVPLHPARDGATDDAEHAEPQ